MGKYIINIEHEDMITNGHLVIPLEVCVQGNDEKIKFNCEVTNDLTPYTEPDMEQVRKEAYENGYENGFIAGHLKAEKSGQSFYEDGYQCGLNDAWEAARKICTNWVLPDSVLSKIFGMDKTIDDIMKESTASEAIEKIRQYEQEQEEQIQVGDEVINRDKKAVVTEITDRFVRIMYSDGSGYALFSENMTKTGRHFTEIAAVLEKMQMKDGDNE